MADVAQDTAQVEPAVGQEVDLTGDGGVKKKYLVLGSGESPTKGSKVTVHYVGRLLTGEEFDSSRGRDSPFVFNLGTGSVISGWDIGVATMKIGEKSILTCASEHAYGARGSPPKIPPNSTLEFEVELLDFEPSEEFETTEEKVGAANKKKAQGNDLVKAGDFKKAITVYKKAIELLDGCYGAEQLSERNQLSSVINLNLGLCYLKVDQPHEAVKACDKTLIHDKDNVKALFRRGQAHLRTGEFEHAETDLHTAVSLDAGNKDIRAELERCRAKAAEHKQRQRKMYAQMFKKISSDDEPKTDAAPATE